MKLTPPNSSKRIKRFDMTPMIDVVLQLIIFFMFTAQFGELARTEIPLPQEQGQPREAAPKPPTIVIDIEADGTILVDSRELSLGELDRIVSAELSRNTESEGVSVRLRPDRSARARHVNDVTRRLAALGVRKWSIATAPSDATEAAP